MKRFCISFVDGLQLKRMKRSVLFLVIFILFKAFPSGFSVWKESHKETRDRLNYCV